MALAADPFDQPLGSGQPADREPGLARLHPGDFMRDARQIPWVADPDGATVKVKGGGTRPAWRQYGRPSNLGKAIEDTYNLERWNERAVVHGFTLPDDELTDMVARLCAIDDRESKQAKGLADAIVKRCKQLAGADRAAAQGTHMHAVTEDDDTGVYDPDDDGKHERSWVARAEAGEVLDLPPHVQAAMLDAYRQALVFYDLEVLAVEVPVVHDGWKQAGTLDRIVRLRRDITFANGVTLKAGTVLLLDVKTGKLKLTAKGVVRYWHSYAVQCAVYAAAVPYRCPDDTRDAWPFDVDQQWAIILHLPVAEALAGKAACRLVLCDIAAGRDAIDRLILPQREWQDRKDLFALAHTDEPVIEVDVVASVCTGPDTCTITLCPDCEQGDPFDGLPNHDQANSIRDAGQCWHHPSAPCERCAPVAPQFNSGRCDHHPARGCPNCCEVCDYGGHVCGGCGDDVAHGVDACPHCLAMIEAEAAAVCADEIVDPCPGCPECEHLATVDHTLNDRLIASLNQQIADRPAIGPTDEGPYVMPYQRDEVKARAGLLDPVARALLNQLAADAVAANRSWHITEPRRRRWNIYRSLIRLGAEFSAGLTDNHVRATVAMVLPEAGHPGVNLGPAIGTLTLEESEQLVAATLRVLGHEPTLTFDDAGRPMWAGVDTPTA